MRRITFRAFVVILIVLEGITYAYSDEVSQGEESAGTRIVLDLLRRNELG
jgi:hypothetical protein